MFGWDDAERAKKRSPLVRTVSQAIGAASLGELVFLPGWPDEAHRGKHLQKNRERPRVESEVACDVIGRPRPVPEAFEHLQYSGRTLPLLSIVKDQPAGSAFDPV
jgi:hypothetical protein